MRTPTSSKKRAVELICSEYVSPENGAKFLLSNSTQGFVNTECSIYYIHHRNMRVVPNVKPSVCETTWGERAPFSGA